MNEDFRTTLYTVGKDGRRKWVYPTIVSGMFRTRRRFIAIILICIYVAMPWYEINGHQAVRLDLIHRKLTLLGNEFLATDTLYLFLAFGVAAFSLFLFTSVLGRVWCGWGCPQTVFLEFVFRPIERLIEGDAATRKRLDEGPWTLIKVLQKLAKFSAFAVISWGLASTFLAYFVGRNELLQMMTQSPRENAGLFVGTLGLMCVLIFQFGWFREQFCSVLCPYARFQSVLMDSNSYAVSYDFHQGEPRKTKGDSLGCVDCGKCIRVCPAGIDIRNGIQLECIQCTSCIDACDSVMTKFGRSKGFIGYATESYLVGKSQRILRPRVLVYAAIVAAYLGALLTLLYTRTGLDIQIVRASGEAPFMKIDDDTLTNHFTLHFANKSQDEAVFSVALAVGDDETKVVTPVNQFRVQPGGSNDLPIFIRFSKNRLLNGTAPIDLEIRNHNAIVATRKLTLLGPDQ